MRSIIAAKSNQKAFIIIIMFSKISYKQVTNMTQIMFVCLRSSKELKEIGYVVYLVIQLGNVLL